MRIASLKLDALRKDQFKITSQGFLVVDANLTRAGVFDYFDKDGNKIRENRPPEEVFKKETLDSMKFAPLTDLHPDEMITIDNVFKHAKGFVGENIRRNTTSKGDFASGKVVITDKKQIQDILDKWDRGEDVELSMGYNSNVVDISGQHPSEGHYDKTQTDIIYNHVSKVPKGRAGGNVKLIMDAEQEASSVVDDKTKLKNNNQEGTMKYKKDGVEAGGFRMDAIEGTIHEDAKDVVERLASKLDEAIAVIKTQIVDAETAGKSTDALQAKFDQLESDSKEVKAKLDELSNPNSETIQNMISERADLEAVAGKLDVKVDKEDGTKKTNKELKVDSIVAVSKDFKVDGKSDDYIGARFDAIKEAIEAKADAKTPASIASLIKDAKDPKQHEKKNPRAEFMKKSDALHEEEDDK